MAWELNKSLDYEMYYRIGGVDPKPLKEESKEELHGVPYDVFSKIELENEMLKEIILEQTKELHFTRKQLGNINEELIDLKNKVKKGE